MKNLCISTILLIALFFTAGNEVMAERSAGRACGVGEQMPNCKDGKCKQLCLQKHPGIGDQYGGGFCSGAAVCFCLFPCKNSFD